jgi:hypothetical protein
MYMTGKKLIATGWILLGLAATSALTLSQTTQQTGTLVVSGQSGQAAVVQVGGRSYVDIEALARLTNGSLSFKGSQTTLTLPAPGANSTASTPPPGDASNSAFSKDFLNAGIETMTVIREWRSAMVNAVQNGYPVTDQAVAGYRAQSTKNLRFAFVAVSSDSDRSAYQLLSNELDNMRKLSAKLLAAHQDMQNITPDALDNDPLNQQILSCARSLVSMASSGQFQDDGSCH